MSSLGLRLSCRAGGCRHLTLGRLACFWLLGVLVSTLVGCGLGRVAQDDIPGSEGSQVSTKAPDRDDLSAPPAPTWGREGRGPGAGHRPPDRDAAAGAVSGQGLYSPEPALLRRQVAARCAAARDYGEIDYLASVVNELYLAAVDPAQATEALVMGDCGSLEAVVRELVAQGGYQVVGPVSSRASLLGGADARRLIEVGVAAGLDRTRATPDASGQASTPRAVPYALAHFSSRSGEATLTGADALNTLYANATPGFGLYTFVLAGPGVAKNRGAQARFRELLRVIETYVPGEEEGGARADVHAFLVAVHPDRLDLPLADQTGPELSDPMRRQLAQALHAAGQGPLARRLETRSGPFLVTGPEPRLLPDGADSPHLLVDLSGVGSAYLYAVVDAFDQPVSKGAGVDALRERLLSLPLGADGAATAREDWVHRVRGGVLSRVAR